MAEKNRYDRREFIAAAAMTIAAAELGLTDSARAQLRDTKAPRESIESGLNKSFGPLRQIDAGLLNE